jgi:hypothetical protein
VNLLWKWRVPCLHSLAWAWVWHSRYSPLNMMPSISHTDAGLRNLKLSGFFQPKRGTQSVSFIQPSSERDSGHLLMSLRQMSYKETNRKILCWLGWLLEGVSAQYKTCWSWEHDTWCDPRSGWSEEGPHQFHSTYSYQFYYCVHACSFQ